jgi:pyrroloquinoline quinone (PQQ) biosynthesis protein C
MKRLWSWLSSSSETVKMNPLHKIDSRERLESIETKDELIYKDIEKCRDTIVELDRRIQVEKSSSVRRMIQQKRDDIWSDLDELIHRRRLLELKREKIETAIGLDMD